MRIRRLLYALALSLCLAATAVAGGSGAYPNGAEGFMAGAAPPPGTYLLLYSNYYSADSYMDDNGDEYTGAHPLADIEIDVWANVLRLLHVSKFKILGGNWAAHVFIPHASMDFDFSPTSPLQDAARDGLGDIIVDPFILTWHGEHFHWVAGLDIYIPTGRYNRETEPVNPGNNVWTFEPVFAVSYLNGPLDVSFKFMYDISTTNDDHLLPTGRVVDRDPGQEFHFDYMLGYQLADPLTVGLGGYFYQQTTDDEVDGVDQANDKGRVLAIGPALKYGYKNMSFTLKCQWETMVENRSEGVSSWFKFLYAF